MSTVRRVISFTLLSRAFVKRIGFLALLGILAVCAVPDTSSARIVAAFGPEDFVNVSGQTTEVRHFQVQYPNDFDYTLHVIYQAVPDGLMTLSGRAPHFIYAGLRRYFEGLMPRALITLNGEPVVTPDEFKWNGHYIKKPITLSEANRLSVKLRGLPGSGMRIVITGKNEQPLVFDFNKITHPDGSNLFGPGSNLTTHNRFRMTHPDAGSLRLKLSYLWTVVDEPEGGNAMLSDRYAASPSLRVDRPGRYGLELRIRGTAWEESFALKLTASNYDTRIPVPLQTRVVQSNIYKGIKIGSTTYAAPPGTNCGSYSTHGFQVLVLDRATQEVKDNRAFHVPCGNQEMIDFLSSLGDTRDTSKYPDIPLVIVSSLDFAPPNEVCDNNNDCPLGRALEELGGTSIFRSHYNQALSYTCATPYYRPVDFAYSLIGVPGVGQNQGTELNNWEHRAVTADSEKIAADIEGYFLGDVKDKWAFVWPEYVEIETHAATDSRSNTIKVGGVSYATEYRASSYYTGGFQVLVLDRDTLQPAASIAETNRTFWTGCTITYWYAVGDELQAMNAYLDSLRSLDNGQQFVVIIASFGTPISYMPNDESFQAFTDLIKTIGNYFGGTIGILNQVRANPTYSLVGLSSTTAGSFGANDTVEANSPGVNLRVFLHKDNQGWFKPAVINPRDEGTTGGPDLGILTEALKPYTPWPLPDPALPTSDPLHMEQLAAYQYISQNLGMGPETDIRSQYVMADGEIAGKWLTYCLHTELQYDNIPAAERIFSREVYDAMWEQLCGDYGEFNYVIDVSKFSDDLDYVLTRMQTTNSESNLDDVYNAVKPIVPVKNDSKVLYNMGIVIRGVLTAGTSITTNAALKAAMGVVNGLMSIAMGLSKKDSGADYTSLDTVYSSLDTDMNLLWSNLAKGKDKAIGIIKSDWGKLQYVAQKLETREENGGWGYYPEDRDDWVDQVTNTLEAYYFQSLIPAVWKIDYLQNTTTIPHPKNFSYYAGSCWDPCCQPYCDGASENPSAFWVDDFTIGVTYPYSHQYSWFVLEDEVDMGLISGCGYVDFDRSAALRDILFGSSDTYWEGGPKLGLELPVFYERWLPSTVYTPYTAPVYPEHPTPYYSDCP